MGRELRDETVGAIYQLTQHATGDELFFQDVFDRFRFEQTLGRAVERFNWDLHSYVQVGNHYHLLVELREQTLALGMKYLNSRYVQGYNQRHDRKGALARARYTSTPIVDEPHYVRTLIYIAMNPVKAGLCRRPEEWEWGSYGGSGTIGRRADRQLRDFFDASLA